MNSSQTRREPMGAPIAGWALAARRWGNLHLVSFHLTKEEADGAARMRIDSDPMEVVEGTIVYASNGNVRRWDLVDPRRIPSIDEIASRLVPRRTARRRMGYFDHCSDSYDMRTTVQRAYRIRLRALGVRAPLTSGYNDTPVRWNSFHS